VKFPYCEDLADHTSPESCCGGYAFAENSPDHSLDKPEPKRNWLVREIPNPKSQITKQKKVEKNNCRKTFYIKLFTALSKNILPENGKTLRLGNLFLFLIFLIYIP